MNTPDTEWREELRKMYQMEEMPTLESFIETLLASERADWLRSEIEKLEGMLELTTDKDSDNAWAFKVHKNKTLTSIITRHKEELLELENVI